MVGYGVPSWALPARGLWPWSRWPGPVATVEVTVPADATLDAELAALMINERPLLVRNYDLFLPAVQRQAAQPRSGTTASVRWHWHAPPRSAQRWLPACAR